LADELARYLPYDIGDEHGLSAVLRTGRADLIRLDEDVAGELTDRDGDAESEVTRLIRELQLTRAITVPIRCDDEIIGALQVLATDAGPARQRDLALAQAVASGIGEALRSRWLADQHRQISATLQRAFLPPTLPTIAGVDVSAAYWPAGAASDVGGDFYDLFRIDDHEWAVLIGDACGTGPDAAATAAIARHTARAAARHGYGHREVLEWVNQAVKHSDRDLFCTACYATLRMDVGDDSIAVTVAAAGHPRPILTGAQAARVVGEHGTLLGVFDDLRLRVDEVVLDAGEAIVFYTDGITDLPPPHGRTEVELADFVSGHSGRTADDLVQHIRADLDDRLSVHKRADDVAVLVIRNAGANRGPSRMDEDLVRQG
jgi:serine phosphatase RsbU (regulator of sigma subunit)